MAYPDLLTPEAFSAATGGKISADDPRVPPLIDGATAAIRRYCGWHVAPLVLADEVTLDGPGGDTLTLRTLRVDDLTSVTEGELALTDGVDFEWSANGEVRRLGGGYWSHRYRSIVVVFDHGFDDAPDLVQIIVQVVANAVASPLGATREQAGALSVSWATTAPGVSGGLSLLERDLAVLDSYRLPPVP